MNAVIKFLKNFKIHHYIVFAVVAAIGIFNAVTALKPIIKQSHREDNIVKTFNQWWDDEGAEQIRSVGLIPDDAIRKEKFDEYRSRYLDQNHTYIIEDRIVEMRQEFREWWEVHGGKEQYAADHKVYPNEKDFERECYKWIKQYTDKHLRYGLAFTPKDAEFGRIFTNWLLFPGVLSFLLFAGLFGFAYTQLSRRWGVPVALGTFVASIILGGILVYVLSLTSFFDHYATERLMGMSAALAFMLGATAFGANQDDVIPYARLIVFLGLIADILVNVFANGGLYVAVAVASLVTFGLGILGGKKIPNRKKSKRELMAEAAIERKRINAAEQTFAAKKKKTRSQIEDGFKAFDEGDYTLAEQVLTQAMTALLQEIPVEFETANDFAERLTSTKIRLEIPSEQWLEWGEAAKAKNAWKAALLLLDKGLAKETNENLIRRAMYSIGEIRVLKDLEKEEGVNLLNKVIEMGDKDILAAQARKLIEKA